MQEVNARCVGIAVGVVFGTSAGSLIGLLCLLDDMDKFNGNFGDVLYSFKAAGTILGFTALGGFLGYYYANRLKNCCKTSRKRVTNQFIRSTSWEPVSKSQELINVRS